MSQEAVVTFLKRLDEDADLRKEFLETVPPRISSQAPIVAFAGKHGFGFTEDDLKSAASAFQAGELADAQLDAVVGGVVEPNDFPRGSLGFRVLQIYGRSF
jgi:predicted ribosomally synthesized peptide with nif11-like leader